MPVSIKIRNADLVKFELVKELILRDITLHYTITQLSGESSLNEFKLKTGFKLLYGKTIYEFLQDHRLQHGIHLLSTSDDSIQEIALKCGYGYATNFIAVFRKKFKIKPTDYRKSSAIKRTFFPGTMQRCFSDKPVVKLYPYPARVYHDAT